MQTYMPKELPANLYMADQTAKVCLLTWNVAETDPPDDLHNLLCLDAPDLPHLYAVGIQEMKSAAMDLVSGAVLNDPWSNKLIDVLSQKNYVQIKSVRLMGIHLQVFLHRAHLAYVTNFESEYTRTGFGGLWGNKGGVSIRMDISGVNVCIVNCHLSAHLPYVAERIQDYDSIVETQRFRNADVPLILDHDYVFWIGDLNFRLDDLTYEEVSQRIKSGDCKSLWNVDQLKKVMKEELILLDFNEGSLTFPPTYKFDPGTDTYDTSSKKRKPAWCDRILWFVHEDSFENASLSVEQLSYTSLAEYKQSDHKPVRAEFLIQVLKYPQELPVLFEPMDYWSAASDGKSTYTLDPAQLQVSAWDWIGLYKASYKHFKDYVTYEWAPVSGDETGDGTVMYSVVFPNLFFKERPGAYCLCYYSSVRDCVVGYSDVFKISLTKDVDGYNTSDEQSSEEDQNTTSPSKPAEESSSSQTLLQESPTADGTEM